MISTNCAMTSACPVFFPGTTQHRMCGLKKLVWLPAGKQEPDGGMKGVSSGNSTRILLVFKIWNGAARSCLVCWLSRG